ncbi:unnamed protein product, partial [Mesorhabditis belari]|uniref:Uncharacterized protein n=1 Tax=Mesorhabditis belari TaxID=2138241 RepID=A0AAF3EBS1_9BILA
MGKGKSSLPDFYKVVQLKPDLTETRIQRGSFLLRKKESLTQRNRVLIQCYQSSRTTTRWPPNSSTSIRAGHCLPKAIETMMWDGSLYTMPAKCYKHPGHTQQAFADQ